MTSPMFEKIALVGIGLIGSSLARVIRREGLARHVSIATRSPTTLARAKELGLGESLHHRRERSGSRCRSGHRLGAGRILGRGRGRNRAGAEKGRHPHRCRLDQGLRHRADAAACAGGRPFHSRPSAGRHGKIRAGRRFRRSVRQSLVHLHAASRAPIRRHWKSFRSSGGAAAPTSTRWTRSITT